MSEEVDGILVAAHELKEPLAVLRQLALSFDGINEMNEQIRSEMIKVSERAIRQVNDLAKIRRLEDGLFMMEPVAIRATCDEVTRELGHLFIQNKKNLLVKYSNRVRLVTANHELLVSVIYNFLANAMHYSGEGMRTELVVKDSNDKVKVIIRDYGPALPIDIWKDIKKGVDKTTEFC